MRGKPGNTRRERSRGGATLIATFGVLISVSSAARAGEAVPADAGPLSLEPDPSRGSNLSLGQGFSLNQSSIAHPVEPLVLASLGQTPRKAPLPGLALLSSLVLPGAGQFLNGDRRGFIYLGAEAAGWFARLSYLDAAHTKEGDSESFARRHWDYTRFSGTTGEDGCLYTASADSALTAMGESDKYYDALGRQDDYRCGWDDFRSGYNPDDPNASSANRTEFRKMRTKADDLADKANLAVTVLVLNRIVSGIDAFQTARRRRAGQSTTGALHLESRLEGSLQDPRAVFALSCAWR